MVACRHPWFTSTVVFKPYLVLRRRTSHASIWPHPHVHALRAQAMSAPRKQSRSERNASSQSLQARQSINALNLEAPPGASSELTMREQRTRLLSERASASFGPGPAQGNMTRCDGGPASAAPVDAAIAQRDKIWIMDLVAQWLVNNPYTAHAQRVTHGQWMAILSDLWRWVPTSLDADYQWVASGHIIGWCHRDACKPYLRPRHSWRRRAPDVTTYMDTWASPSAKGAV